MIECYKDFEYHKDESGDSPRPYMFACKDHECKNMERWVIACLSEKEARELYEFLGKHLN